MFISYFIFSFFFNIQNIKSNQIEIDIPSISSSHTFELSSNTSEYLHRDVLFGLVDSTTSSIPSSIVIRTSYKQLEIEHFFNLYQSNNKQSIQPIKKEPIFRSYLLTSSFNRSYPFIKILIASAQGSYEHLHIQPICALITAVNEQNLYETQTCFISPQTGYCLGIISLLKMIEYINKNQTTNKIEFYSKLYHVKSFNECLSDSLSKQDHIHHETRIGYVEYHDYDNILFSTIIHSFISIDYPIGIHYPNWYFPLKLKLIHSTISIYSSFIIRCRLISDFSIYLIQTNIHKLSNYNIQINHNISSENSFINIDFNIIIKQLNQINENNLFEIDLATILLKINSKNMTQYQTNSIVFIDWFILTNKSLNSNQIILQIPIHIEYDDIQTIVGLTDFTNLINTAMLSMEIQQFPLKILTVNYSGSIQLINQAVCHSENIYLIQVDSNCKYIYFSGHERDDYFDQINNPTSIIIRYEKYFQRLHFIIYIPERPLRIELTDTKLSRINGWFTTTREDQEYKNESKTNEFDEEDDEDEDDEEEEEEEEVDVNVKCYPVYQQSHVHVYTKFYRTTPNGDRIYLFNKLNVLITPFVRKHLETDDKRVAIIKNGRVIGINPGKTNVRIYSFTNKLPMGSKTIYVNKEEMVDIKNISFNILTHIDIQTNLIEHIDPIYKIFLHIQPIFNRFYIEKKNQFGQINIILTYSDNTTISLDDISSDSYQFELDFSRTNPSLIQFDSSISWKNLHIYPLAVGHTSIHARLKFGRQQCTDDRIFSQNQLSCEINLLSNNLHQLNQNKNLHSSLYQQTDQYVILNNNNNNNNHHHHHDQQRKTSPFLIVLSILLGACIVLFISFLLHWIINCYFRKKSNHDSRRQRHSTNSGAEEDNHDWIFLDRNSLEMPIKQQQQNSPSIHNSTLHITSNPIINTSTLQRQKEFPDLSHSQMIAYFNNLKESHA